MARKENRGRKTVAPVTKPKLMELVDHYGSFTNLAFALRINRTRIHNWMYTKARMPARIAARIEKITNGKFGREDFGTTCNWP